MKKISLKTLIAFTLLNVIYAEKASDCASKEVPKFDIVDWMFTLPDEVAEVITKEKVSDTSSFHGHRKDIKLIMDFLITNETGSDFTDDGTFFKTYVKKYPALVRKMACGSLDPSLEIITSPSINWPTLYKLIVVVDGDWEFLTPLKLRQPERLTAQEQKELYLAMVDLLSKVDTNDPNLEKVYAGFPEYLQTLSSYVISKMESKGRMLDDFLKSFLSGSTEKTFINSIPLKLREMMSSGQVVFPYGEYNFTIREIRDMLNKMTKSTLRGSQLKKDLELKEIRNSKEKVDDNMKRIKRNAEMENIPWEIIMDEICKASGDGLVNQMLCTNSKGFSTIKTI